jgi:hypothetical protein
MIPSFPRLKWPLDEMQVSQLNKALSELRDLLTGGLETNENTVNDIIDIPFQAPNTPSIRMPSKPLGVVPLSFESSTNPRGSIAMTNPFQWSWSAGLLTIPSLAGLTGATKYVLRVRIERG